MSADEPTRPPTRVEISAGAHQVIVEAVGSLNAVSKKALELWQATESDQIGRGYGSMGFHTDLYVELVDDVCPEPDE